ncbi:MAG: PorT family protein [Saprospirales bacterium]|nr:PorT family protein [Saprospirales bacterium]MBK8352136.1 PorT family protein [Saprospirales bacterium]
MKKIILFLLLAGTFINHSQAKIQAGIGVKVGGNFGRWNNTIGDRLKLVTVGGTFIHEPGINAGIQGRIWINKFVGVNLAAEFNMGGSRSKTTQGTTITTTSHKENQLTVPISVLAGWGNERLRIFASLGGYFGYVINGKDKVTKNINGSEGSPVTTKADYKDVYKNIDAGIRLGGGVQVYVDKKLRSCVTFDVNYDYGFIKAYKTQPAVYSELKITPSKLNFAVGYMYTFGKDQHEEAPKRTFEATEE